MGYYELNQLVLNTLMPLQAAGNATILVCMPTFLRGGISSINLANPCCGQWSESMQLCEKKMLIRGIITA